MRRADRLMQIIQLLRDGDLHRAGDLARATGVSLRTIYRDMDTLAASGVPIAGERGAGYRVTAAITLPPLNLTMVELEALHLSLAAIGQAADDDLRNAARSLSAKIDAVLPEDRSKAPASYGFAIYPFADAARGFQHLPVIRQAIRARQKLVVTLDGKDRTVRPLKLDYWGRLWTSVVWCETSRGFAELRIDQISALRLLPSLFVAEKGKTLADFTS
jgi:predicted DNA-binding transcriptional regulator YafY